MRTLELYNGNCLTELQKIADNTIDSVVTDPPYELGFMGKSWDASGIAFNVEVWRECLRVLKPGGHILAFGGTRTYHRMTVAIEDAGFEIRDCMAWMYGSGFPKSHNIGKAIDKIQGNEREVVGTKGLNSFKGTTMRNHYGDYNKSFEEVNKLDRGYTEWEGWGTALKPAFEPIVMGRKPFKGTVADNVLEWGVGGLNIDESRVGNESRTVPVHSDDKKEDETLFGLHPTIQHHREETTIGRWPANVMLECTCEKVIEGDKGEIKYSSGSRDNVNLTHEWGYNDIQRTNYTDTGNIHTDPNCPCYILDQQSGDRKGMASQNCNNQKLYGGNAMNVSSTTRDGFKEGYNDTGGASRFFYCPKANKKDRDEGLNIQPQSIKGRDEGQDKTSIAYKARPTERQNIHPTVKPTTLMEYLIKLVTPKGGKVLDPFMGSGSTGKGAVLNDYSFVGIELSPEYFAIAESRINAVKDKTKFWA